jgi:hypothetical protein
MSWKRWFVALEPLAGKYMKNKAFQKKTYQIFNLFRLLAYLCIA